MESVINTKNRKVVSFAAGRKEHYSYSYNVTKTKPSTTTKKVLAIQIELDLINSE